jgi:N-carbamoylputrescine amidase
LRLNRWRSSRIVARDGEIVKTLRVTVCQWPDSKEAIPRAWDGLVAHVRGQSSHLVVLPEMPFYPWVASARKFNAAQWSAAVAAHDAWEERFPELGGAAVLGTRPVDFGNERYNEGFVWEAETGSRAAHTKAFLPNEEGAWEVTWYHAATPEFTPAQVGDSHIGFLISTELWAMEQARQYGEDGARILATPRITSGATREKWLAAGRTAAVLAGAFGLSSNKADSATVYGGQGWIIDPDGNVIATTSEDFPYVTAEIDLTQSQNARATYPRNVFTGTKPPNSFVRQNSPVFTAQPDA